MEQLTAIEQFTSLFPTPESSHPVTLDGRTGAQLRGMDDDSDGATSGHIDPRILTIHRAGGVTATSPARTKATSRGNPHGKAAVAGRQARAAKTFQCKIPGCPKKNRETGEARAYGSKNDLTRHYRDMHRLDANGLPIEGHCCPHQDCKRNKAAAGFSRLSNLNDHITRKHGGIWPTETLTKNSKQIFSRPTQSRSEAGPSTEQVPEVRETIEPEVDVPLSDANNAGSAESAESSDSQEQDLAQEQRYLRDVATLEKEKSWFESQIQRINEKLRLIERKRGDYYVEQRNRSRRQQSRDRRRAQRKSQSFSSRMG